MPKFTLENGSTLHLVGVGAKRISTVQSLDDYENREEEREFMKSVAQGLLEIREGKFISLKDAKKKL